MASEYLKKKYQDVKPDEPLVLTPKERRKNWWYYHKWQIVAVAAVLLLVGLLLKDIFCQTEPDYRISYVGSEILSDETAEEAEKLLKTMGEDRNGDGQILVQVDSYVIGEDDYTAYAMQMKLISELQIGDSEIFLLEDPAAFQQSYSLLLLADGTMPEDDVITTQCECFAWRDCPAVNQLDLGMELYLARRGYVTEEEISSHADYIGLWQAITAGAKPAEN